MRDSVRAGEYVHSECESWSGGRKTVAPQSYRHLPKYNLSLAWTWFLTHTYFPSLSSKRPGVKM